MRKYTIERIKELKFECELLKMELKVYENDIQVMEEAIRQGDKK